MSASDHARIPAFDKDGIWLRCNLHAHTTESDGLLGPNQLAKLYSRAGYDLLAISDHDDLTELPETTGDLLLMPASEISLRAPQTKGPLHVLALGIDGMPEVNRAMALAEVTALIADKGGLAVIAHPWWSGLRPDELEPYSGVTAIEIYNAGCEVEQARGHSSQFWDALLANGVYVGGIATDDHHIPGFDTFRGWTMVRAKERSVESALQAIREGDYFASTGPAILNIEFDGDSLLVESSPVKAISAIAQPPYGARVNAGSHGLNEFGRSEISTGGRPVGDADGELLTRVRFTLPFDRGLKYVRVQIEDGRGGYAWSNPILLD